MENFEILKDSSKVTEIDLEPVILTRKGNTFYLILNHGDNKISVQMVTQIWEKLDNLLENNLDGCSLITFSTHPKIFSNGGDIPSCNSTEELGAILIAVSKMLAKIVSLPLPTLAVVNGHAFGVGAYIAIWHDYRFMRSDRGYIWWNEMLFGAGVPSSYNKLGMAKLGAKNYFDLFLKSTRLTADAAVKRDVIDRSISLDRIFEEAEEFSLELQGYNKDSKSIGMTKWDIYHDTINCLNNESSIDPHILNKVYSHKEKMAKL